MCKVQGYHGTACGSPGISTCEQGFRSGRPVVTGRQMLLTSENKPQAGTTARQPCSVVSKEGQGWRPGLVKVPTWVSSTRLGQGFGR